MERGTVLWLEGLIGAGKSTLAQKIAGLMEFRAFHEPVEVDYLDKFYKDPRRYAFEFQLRQLARREAIHHAAQWEAITCTDFKGSILDRGLPGDRVFARLHVQMGNISAEQWMTYELLFKSAMGRLQTASLLVFLDVEPEVAMERVRNRNRGSESGLSIDYLRMLRKGYLDLMSEVESKESRWSDGLQIMRVPWNLDHQEAAPLVDKIKDRLHLK